MNHVLFLVSSVLVLGSGCAREVVVIDGTERGDLLDGYLETFAQAYRAVEICDEGRTDREAAFARSACGVEVYLGYSDSRQDLLLTGLERNESAVDALMVCADACDANHDCAAEYEDSEEQLGGALGPLVAQFHDDIDRCTREVNEVPVDLPEVSDLEEPSNTEFGNQDLLLPPLGL